MVVGARKYLQSNNCSMYFGATISRVQQVYANSRQRYIDYNASPGSGNIAVELLLTGAVSLGQTSHVCCSYGQMVESVWSTQHVGMNSGCQHGDMQADIATVMKCSVLCSQVIKHESVWTSVTYTYLLQTICTAFCSSCYQEIRVCFINIILIMHERDETCHKDT